MMVSCFLCSSAKGCCAEVHPHHRQWCQVGLWSQGAQVILNDTLHFTTLDYGGRSVLFVWTHQLSVCKRVKCKYKTASTNNKENIFYVQMNWCVFIHGICIFTSYFCEFNFFFLFCGSLYIYICRLHIYRQILHLFTQIILLRQIYLLICLLLQMTSCRHLRNITNTHTHLRVTLKQGGVT